MDRRIAREIAQQITATPSKISMYDWALMTSGYDLNAIYTLFQEVIDTKMAEPIVFEIVKSWDFASFDYTWDKTSTPWKKKFADKEELKVEIEKIIMRIKQERHLGIEPNKQSADTKSEVVRSLNPPKHTKISPKRKELTWDEKKQCFKNAVLSIMEQKMRSGDYLFKKSPHWKAVYRFAVDLGIMYDVNDPNKPNEESAPQYAVFEKFAHELQLDVNPPTRIPFTKNAIDNFSNELFARYNLPYPWPEDDIITNGKGNISFFIEMQDIYNALDEKYDELLSQAERSL